MTTFPFDDKARERSDGWGCLEITIYKEQSSSIVGECKRMKANASGVFERNVSPCITRCMTESVMQMYMAESYPEL